MGLTGDPVVFLNRIGAMVIINVQRPSSRQTEASCSSSKLSSTHIPMAHMATTWKGASHSWVDGRYSVPVSVPTTLTSWERNHGKVEGDRPGRCGRLSLSDD